MMFQGQSSGNTAIGHSNMAPFLPEFTVSGGYRWDQSTRALSGQCRYTSLAGSAADTVTFWLPLLLQAALSKAYKSASCFEDFMYSD